MGLKSIFSGRPASQTAATGEYIDLDDFADGSELVDATANMMVRVAEIQKYDELREYANYVYQGNMLIMDFSAIAEDKVILDRVISDLKRLVADINGDIAGMGETTMIIAPTGVKIDRRKARSGY